MSKENAIQQHRGWEGDKWKLTTVRFLYLYEIDYINWRQTDKLRRYIVVLGITTNIHTYIYTVLYAWPSTKHTPSAKLISVTVSKGLLELRGYLMFQVCKECNMQACSPGWSWAVCGLEGLLRDTAPSKPWLPTSVFVNELFLPTCGLCAISIIVSKLTDCLNHICS